MYWYAHLNFSQNNKSQLGSFVLNLIAKFTLTFFLCVVLIEFITYIFGGSSFACENVCTIFFTVYGLYMYCMNA